MIDVDGQVVKCIDVIFKVVRMIDGIGKYCVKEMVLVYGEEVYIYIFYIGVLMLYKIKVVGNMIIVDINWDMVVEEFVQICVEGEYQIVFQGFYILGSWNVKGCFNYLDSEGVIELIFLFYQMIN